MDAPHKAKKVYNRKAFISKLIEAQFKELSLTYGSDLETIRKQYEPVIRKDLEILLNYRIKESVKLKAPFIITGGKQDLFYDPKSLQSWQELSQLSCKHYLFPGGHLYLFDHKDALLSLLVL